MLIVPCQPAIAEAPSLPRSPPVNVISNVCHLSNRPLVFVNILKSICQYPQQKFRVPSLVFTLAPGGCPSSTIPRESFLHENRMLNTCDQGMSGVLQTFADEHFLTPMICSQDVVRKNVMISQTIPEQIELFIAQKYWWLMMDGSERFQVGLRPGGNFESLTSHGFPLWQRFSSNSIILWCIRSANSLKIS